MEIIDFSKRNSIINKYMAEMRDKNYQNNRLLFRNNIMRVGELIAYELSKTLDYEERDVQTPLGTAKVNVPTDKVVLGTIFRAGLPFHQGFLNIFDHAGNAFVSAYREYEDAAHTKVGITWNILPLPTSTTPLSSSSTRCLPPADQWRWATRRSSPRAPRSAFTWSA